MRAVRMLALVWALLLTTWGVAPASAGTGDVVPNGYQVIGGCTLAFDGAGQAYLAPSRTRPCIGAKRVYYSSVGDVVVYLSWGADDPTTRLTAAADGTLAGRGISVGATRAKGTISLRYYDDQRGDRLDMRDPAQRARVAGGMTNIGWVGHSAVPADQINYGLDEYGPFHDRATTSRSTVPGGCVIRFGTSGPWIHANVTHHCTGVRSVGVTSAGKLKLVYSDEQRGSVVNLSADPDETLTSRGIIAGASTSFSEMHVQLYDTVNNRPLNLTRSADRARVAGETSNMWFTWTKTTDRPGTANATFTPATDKYGPYINGSAGPDDVQQTGCEIKFAQTSARPTLYSDAHSRCAGVSSVVVNGSGQVVVYASPGATGPVIGTSTVSNRRVTDYGVRAGLSGGGAASTYTLYSIKLGRRLNLNSSADRVVMQRSGSALYVGWSRPWG